MAVQVGVVGPHDLVDDVAAVCEEQSRVTAYRLNYGHESEAPAITAAHASSVDAWLFTGVVPYTLCREAETLTRPAVFVDYTGATLLQALVRLVREGHDVSRMSIDTLSTADVVATFTEAGVPVASIATLPYRGGVTSAQTETFHRRARRGSRGSQVALTCLRSVYEKLRGEMPVHRLAPSTHAVRNAVRQLLLETDNQMREDAQLVIGLAELSGGDEGLLKEVVSVGGTTTPLAGGMHLLISTRGPLYAATNGFSGLPMLRRLAELHETVRIGFGLGRGAAEAENLARRALSRARKVGPVASVLSTRDADLILAAAGAPADPAAANLTVVAQRVGLSVATLQRLREVRESAGSAPVNTRDLADRLGVQPRTARRMLNRLELAGLAERTGSLASGTSGRPSTLYRITL